MVKVSMYRGLAKARQRTGRKDKQIIAETVFFGTMNWTWTLGRIFYGFY